MEFDPARPFVWRGACKDWVASRKWSTDFFRNQYGSEVVQVQECNTGTFCTMQVHEYLDYLNHHKNFGGDKLLYWAPQILKQTAFEPLFHDYPGLPQFPRDRCVLWNYGTVCRGPLHFLQQFQWIFLGPGGAFTRTHIDPVGSAAWNALISGRKRFVFVDPKSEDAQQLTLDCHPFQANGIYPQFREKPSAECQEIVMETGDVVYTPPLWPHYVENLEESISVTENFVFREHHVGFDRALQRTTKVPQLTLRGQILVRATRAIFKAVHLAL